MTENTVVKKIGEARRVLSGIQSIIFICIGITFSVVQLYALTISPLDPWILRSLHVSFACVLGFLLFKPSVNSNVNRFGIIDIILSIVSAAIAIYVMMNFEDLAFRLTMMPSTSDVIVSSLLIALVLELTRRTVGLPLVIIAVVALFYSWAGQFLPGFVWHRGYDWMRTSGYLLSTDGIYGVTIGVSSTFIFMFILFGAFLQISGTGEFLIKFAYSLAGRFRGGPAKVAIFASALMGTISGSAVANVVTTGSMTIPLMMKVGYKPWFAGAVEAVASTGGQLMPPVMGAGAFLMAEMISKPYLDIVIAATIPAILYYLALLWFVDLEAIKENLVGLPANELPNFKEVIKKGWIFFSPIVVLVWSLIIARHSPIKAATLALITSIVVSWFIPTARMGIKEILKGLSRGASDMVTVAAVCAAAGIVVGILGLTGLGLKFASVLIDIAGGNLMIALIISMIVCLVLGMGLPTTPAYAVVGSVVAPGLIKMGLEPISAHLFCFFFACIGPITPPVAVASYAAGAIAHTNPTKVGWVATRLGVIAFIIPYIFVYGPGLLMKGGIINILSTSLTAIVGIGSLGCSLQGLLLKQRLMLFPRILLFAASLLLLKPGLITDAMGIFTIVAALILNKILIKAKGKSM